MIIFCSRAKKWALIKVGNRPELAEASRWHRGEPLPKINKKSAPGSDQRILLYHGTDSVNWEGKDVGQNDPIPEITPQKKK